MKKIILPIVEKFYSIQGESFSIGRPAFFIRFPGCTLKCKWCDTLYASRKKINQGTKIELLELIKEIKSYPSHLIVVTGGEPLIHRKEIKALIQHLEGYQFEIETNGTLPPLNMPSYELTESLNFVRYNVSPKLNSSGNKRQDAIKPRILKQFLKTDCLFKFVVSNDQDWNEMERLLKKIKIPKEDVWIMPRAITYEEWKKNSLWLLKKIKEVGYNLSPRLQIMLYGKKRGV